MLICALSYIPSFLLCFFILSYTYMYAQYCIYALFQRLCMYMACPVSKYIYLATHQNTWAHETMGGCMYSYSPAGLSIYESHDVGDEIKYVYTKSRLLSFQLFHKPSMVWTSVLETHRCHIWAVSLHQCIWPCMTSKDKI